MRDLCLMKCSNEMLKIFSYFWNEKIKVVFFFVLCCFTSSLMNGKLCQSFARTIYQTQISCFLCVIYLLKRLYYIFFILHRYVPVAENIIHMNNISSIVSIPASRFGSKGENASLTL